MSSHLTAEERAALIADAAVQGATIVCSCDGAHSVVVDNVNLRTDIGGVEVFFSGASAAGIDQPLIVVNPPTHVLVDGVAVDDPAAAWVDIVGDFLCTVFCPGGA